MQLDAIIQRMEIFPGTIHAQLGGLTEQDLRWKPAPEQWSLLEILRHLGDEEVEDFRMRVRLTLEDPDADWPPIDPEGVAVSRAYNNDDPQEALDRFTDERKDSIAWLRALPAQTDWNQAHTHPKFGPMSAGMLMASWPRPWSRSP